MTTIARSVYEFTPPTKRCPRCETVKPAAEFYPGRIRNRGLSAWCKICSRAYAKARRDANPDVRAKDRAHYHRNKHRYTTDPQSPRSPEGAKLTRKRLKLERPAKYRANKFFDSHRADIGPGVTREYLEHLFSTVKNCQCCGKVLYLGYRPRPTTRYRGDPDSPSIDRVNNDKRHVLGNLAVVCWECNFRKTDLTLAELQRFVAYIQTYGLFDEVAS